tara:strand:+ start:1603 stop:1821 length:219 start_codon:yes stop_codon:yes gene_type:complete
MRDSSFVLTTIGNGIVAIVQTNDESDRKRGEYSLSRSCVDANVSSGQFIDVTDKVGGAEGKVFALKTDLTND